jgi:monoamine oxidase
MVCIGSHVPETIPGKIKDPDQPFGAGLDELDKIPLSDIYKKEGASEAALRFPGREG